MSTALAKDSTALVKAVKGAEDTLVGVLNSKEVAERMWRVTLVLVRRTPKLQQCSIQSIVAGMLQSAQLGLELGTEAYLVPMGSEAAFIPDWKGLVRLAIDAGSIHGAHADLVYEQDDYTYRRTGTGVEFAHQREPFGIRAATDNVQAHKDAGCKGVYFLGYTPNGSPPIVGEMSLTEVEYVRNTYSKAKGGDLWTKRWSAGAIKTVTKQTLKMVPKSPTSKLQQAIELDNRFDTGIPSGVLDEEVATARDAESSEAVRARTAERLESGLESLRGQMDESGRALPEKDPSEAEVRKQDAELALE